MLPENYLPVKFSAVLHKTKKLNLSERKRTNRFSFSASGFYRNHEAVLMYSIKI